MRLNGKQSGVWGRPEFVRESGWMLLAVLAIGLALLLLLVPQAHQNSGADFVAILPLLLAGIISPLSLLGLLTFQYASRVVEEPTLVAAFQRPPPFRRQAVLTNRRQRDGGK